MTHSDTTSGDDDRLSALHAATLADITSTLDPAAGLRDVLLSSRHRAILDDVTDSLDVDAGLRDIVAQAPQPKDIAPSQSSPQTGFIALQQYGRALAQRRPYERLARRTQTPLTELRLLQLIAEAYIECDTLTRDLDHARDRNRSLDRALSALRVPDQVPDRAIARAVARALDRSRSLDRCLTHARDRSRSLDRCLTHALDLYRDLDRSVTHVLDLYRAHAYDLDLPRALARALDLYRSLTNAYDHAVDLDLTLGRVRVRDLGLPLGRALDRVRDLGFTRELALDRGRDLTQAYDHARACARALAYTLPHTLDHALDRDLDRDLAYALERARDPIRKFDCDIASGLVAGVDAVEAAVTDFTEADLTNLDVFALDLRGVRWSILTTRWPPGSEDTIREASVQVDPDQHPDVYEIRDDPRPRIPHDDPRIPHNVT